MTNKTDIEVAEEAKDMMTQRSPDEVPVLLTCREKWAFDGRFNPIKVLEMLEVIDRATGECVWTRDKDAVACVRFDVECYPGGYAIDWASPDADIGFNYCPYCGKKVIYK